MNIKDNSLHGIVKLLSDMKRSVVGLPTNKESNDLVLGMVLYDDLETFFKNDNFTIYVSDDDLCVPKDDKSAPYGVRFDKCGLPEFLKMYESEILEEFKDSNKYKISESSSGENNIKLKLNGKEYTFNFKVKSESELKEKFKSLEVQGDYLTSIRFFKEE